MLPEKDLNIHFQKIINPKPVLKRKPDYK